MKLEQHGKNTSVKVLGINETGLWLFADHEEHFLNFDDFPWFRSAPVSAVFNVEQQGLVGYCWPDIDVDLTLDGIKHPEKYPMRSKH